MTSTDAEWGGGMRPIHTAPRDGTPILIYNPKWQCAIVARWEWFEVSSGEDEDYDGFYWISDLEGVEIDGVWGLIGYKHQRDKGLMPTHWMPLPKDPTPEETEAAERVSAEWRVYDKAIRRHDRRHA